MLPTALALAMAVAAPVGKDATKDPRSIVGEWLAESAIAGGKPDNPPEGTTWTFTAEGKSILALGGESRRLESTYKTDPKKDPAWLDIAEGPKGTPLAGIYKVDGDTLTLCLCGKVGNRPTAFESPAGSSALLLVLKRVKPKD
jgi:uncharacterized protein (TIGR03067 family)